MSPASARAPRAASGPTARRRPAAPRPRPTALAACLLVAAAIALVTMSPPGPAGPAASDPTASGPTAPAPPGPGAGTGPGDPLDVTEPPGAPSPETPMAPAEPTVPAEPAVPTGPADPTGPTAPEPGEGTGVVITLDEQLSERLAAEGSAAVVADLSLDRVASGCGTAVARAQVAAGGLLVHLEDPARIPCLAEALTGVAHVLAVEEDLMLGPEAGRRGPQ